MADPAGGAGGLTDDGLGAVRATLEGGVSLRGVNVMTMDFGSAQGSDPDMLALSTQALESTHGQLSDLYLRLGVQLTSPQVWSRIGATPMIGQNDVDAERFTVDDARGLATFAVDKGLGRVSMWSLNRDTRMPWHLHQRRRALQHVQWGGPGGAGLLVGLRGAARKRGGRVRPGGRRDPEPGSRSPTTL